MRICVVGPTYPYRGGIAHYTTLLVRHLRERGHWVGFYSFTRQYPRWFFPGKTDKDPSTAPLRVACEYVLDPVNPVTWWQLYRKVRADEPALLVLQWWVPYWTPSLAMISRWIRHNTSIAIVFICHNVVPHEGGGVLDRRLAWTVLHQAHAFIVHSDQDRYRLLALLPGATVVKTHHPTYVELAEHQQATSAQMRQQLGLPADCPILLFFGFVRPYKGLEYLIQALPLVLQQQRVHLLVVGEFWTAPSFYQSYAHEFGVEHAVTFINRYIPNEELQHYFGVADVVVLPYVEATQSGVVQLAFGFGKSVITTSVGGLHEVVQDGVNGLIVPPQDVGALARAIVRFFAEDLASTQVAHVLQVARSQSFSWQELIQCLEHIYQVVQPAP